VRVFELGRVYAKDSAVAAGPLEVAVSLSRSACGLAFGPAEDEQWGFPVSAREVDFFDVKGDLERLLAKTDVRFEAATHPAFHPGRCARIFVAAMPIGWIGELHPRLQHKYELPRPPVLFEVDVTRFAPLLCRDFDPYPVPCGDSRRCPSGSRSTPRSRRCSMRCAISHERIPASHACATYVCSTSIAQTAADSRKVAKRT